MLEIDIKTLINKAISSLKNSYAPYSHFNVAACVLTKSGKIYSGVNIENASYSAVICAERTAIFKAISEGEKEIVAIAIVGGKNGEISDYCYPCGICRQVMCEFCNPDTFSIIVAKSEEDYIIKTLSELLPNSFNQNTIS